MIRPMVILPPVIFMSLAVLFYLGLARSDPDALPSTFIGQLTPQVLVTPLGADAPFAAADLQKPGVKIVNFWASWCQPCRAEHPQLIALQAMGVPVYGVNYKDEATDALGFLVEMGTPYEKMGQDGQGRMALEWGVYGVPETFVIDGVGKVLLRWAGPIAARNLENDILPAIVQAEALASK